MSVYVDYPIHGLGRMKMCHMAADTREELLEMADRIGLARRWIQCEGSHREHFDICKSKRAMAVSNGAIVMSTKEIVKILQRRKDASSEVTSRRKPEGSGF